MGVLWARLGREANGEGFVTLVGFVQFVQFVKRGGRCNEAIWAHEAWVCELRRPMALGFLFLFRVARLVIPPTSPRNFPILCRTVVLRWHRAYRGIPCKPCTTSRWRAEPTLPCVEPLVHRSHSICSTVRPHCLPLPRLKVAGYAI